MKRSRLFDDLTSASTIFRGTWLILWLTGIILMGCAIDEKPTPATENRTIVNNPALSSRESVAPEDCVNTAWNDSDTALPAFSLHEIELDGFTRKKSGYYSSKQAFIVPEDTLSFQVMAFEDPPSTDPDGIQICSLINPEGDELLPGKCSLWFFGMGRQPVLPDTLTKAGVWTFEVISGKSSGQVFLGLRNNSMPVTRTIVIQPYLTGTSFTTAQIQQAMDRVVAIYANVGIQLVYEPVAQITDSAFETITADFNQDTTVSMVCQSRLSRANLFFVEDLIGGSSSRGSLLGISSGIPGPHGIKSRYSGVLIGLNAHVRGGLSTGTLDIKLLGETAAHEMGHWLGLSHTSERNGDLFDDLDDTPQCPISLAATPSRGVTVDDCRDLDGLNLMFWAAPSNRDLEQTWLTSQQSQVVVQTPIIQ
ncbi:MAG: hypothetical protein HQM11_16305 [SAR324 cluster bacterium]|nr:hypothetical protein [SAR324 cluster bacterium]